MSTRHQKACEEVCRQVYREAKSFYETISKDLKDDPGFQILYGPPFFRAPVLFLGYQPGQGCKSALEEREYGSEDRWPEKSEFATECWPLATNLRRMFGREFIGKCVGTNAIFVRADSIDDYRESVEKGLRTEIEKFCIICVKRMMEAIQPMLIVAIGFSTLDLFDVDAVPATRNEEDRVLSKAGKIFGQDAIGVLHLSGARISEQDREAIACEIGRHAGARKGD